MKSFEASFSDWIQAKKKALDDACGAAMQDGIAGLTGPQLAAANEALNELYADTSSGVALPGGDCDYSLRGVGHLYTGHWHGKRVHDAISILLPLRTLLAQSKKVIDVGAGTDATLWAWTLLACFSSECRSPVPKLSWTSLDSSREMLEQGDRLWKALCGMLPNARNVVDRQSYVGDWRRRPALPVKSLVVGSYVFSRSDSKWPQRTAADFAAFIEKCGASALVIWTTSNKSGVLHKLRNEFARWTDRTPDSLFRCPLQGQMHKCLSVANTAVANQNVPLDPEWPRRFNWGKAPVDASVLAMVR